MEKKAYATDYYSRSQRLQCDNSLITAKQHSTYLCYVDIGRSRVCNFPVC